MLKLFYAPGTCALAAHIALIDSGAKYETARVDFAKEEQRKPEFLKINPKARVPALITDRGVLTEVPAILAYIAQSYPNSKLAPLNDPFVFAQAQAFSSYICSTLHVAHAHRMRGYRWADDPAAIEAMKRKVPDSVGACYAQVENDLFAGPWVLGETYSICDPYLFTVAQWMEGDGVDPARYPKVHDHRTRMAARASVKQALAEERA